MENGKLRSRSKAGIARRDKKTQDAVVMSLEQFNGLMETAHLLKSPANALHRNPQRKFIGLLITKNR